MFPIHSMLKRRGVRLTAAALLLIIPGVLLIAYGCSGDRQGPLATFANHSTAAKPDAGVNCLSFPVIWAEGVQKTLPGTAGNAPSLNGEWWYWWGTEGVDPNIVPLSCAPLLDPGTLLCLDGMVPGVGHEDELVRAYLQKDVYNVWQAGSGTPAEAGAVEADGRIYVDWIDWGDNLESVDWYTRSQVRTEIVLFEDNPDPAFVPTADFSPWLEYEMRHTSGWGIDEVHGIATTLEGEPLIGTGAQATIYSPCARFMIQKINVDRSDTRLVDLIWVPGEGWTEPEGYPDDLINPAIFNGAAHEAGDGPGYYSAEINVKGRIIYGYTWNVRKLNEGPGDYRLTFSFDDVCGGVTLNTAFVEGYTEIMMPLEEEIAASSEPVAGGRGVLDFANNLTYMDIHILERGGGGGGKHDRDEPGGGGGGGPRY